MRLVYAAFLAMMASLGAGTGADASALRLEPGMAPGMQGGTSSPQGGIVQAGSDVTVIIQGPGYSLRLGDRGRRNRVILRSGRGHHVDRHIYRENYRDRRLDRRHQRRRFGHGHFHNPSDRPRHRRPQIIIERIEGRHGPIYREVYVDREARGHRRQHDRRRGH